MVAVVDLVWGPVDDRWVEPTGIVAGLDISGYIFHRVGAGRVDGAVDELVLEFGEE